MRRRFRWRIPLRVQVVALLLLTALPVLGYAMYAAWLERDAGHALALDKVDRLAAAVSAAHTSLLERNRLFLQGLAETESFRSLNPWRCLEILDSVVQRYPQYRSLSVRGAPNGAECTARGVVPAGLPTLAKISVPILAGGTATGTLDGELVVPWVDRLGSKLPTGAIAALLDRAGRVLAFHSTGAASEHALPEPRELAGISGPPPKTAILDGRDGVRRPYGIVPLAATDSLVAVGLADSELTGSDQRFRMHLQLLLGATVFGILLGWLGIELLMGRWLRGLTGTLMELSGGGRGGKGTVPRLRSELRLVSSLVDLAGHRANARETRLRGALSRREQLLREVHRGVAINLRVIASLLNLGTQDPRPARRSLLAAQARIHALELVHERALGGEDAARVDLLPLLLELCDQLLALHEGIAARCELDIPSVKVSVPSAVALALVVTEAVMNALQHAFPDGRDGTVFLSLLGSDGEFRMTIADNGIGFDAEAEAAPHSLGIRLMRAMAQQFGAELQVSSASGSVVVLTFPRSRLE